MDINSIFSGTMTHLTRLTLAGLVALAPASALGQRSSRAAELSALSSSLERVVTKVAPAVVQIRVAAYGPVGGGSTGPSALLGTQRSTGSGLVVSPDGYIVTNAHVIEGGRRFFVVLPRAAAPGAPQRSTLPPVSQEVPATVVGTDPETDLAVLKVELSNLPYAPLGQ